MRRLVFIVKSANVANPRNIAKHANIVKCWRLKGEILLLEVYDDVFQRLHSDDPEVVKAAYQDSSIRERRIAFDETLRAMFAPLYQSGDRATDRVVALIPSKSTNYEFLGSDKHRIAWPELGVSLGWDEAASIQVTGRLFTAIPEAVVALNRVFRDWHVATATETTDISDVVVNERDFVVQCNFRNPSGDALIALYAVLTDTRALTSLERVGFSRPGSASNRYLKIGRSR